MIPFFDDILVDGRADTKFLGLTDTSYTSTIQPSGLTQDRTLLVVDEDGTLATREWADGRFVNLTTPYEDPIFVNTLDWNKIINAPDFVTETEAAATYIPLTQKGAASGVVPLGVDLKIASIYLPPIAITETFVVNSQAAMLALTAQTGDVAVRTDLNKTFILAAEPASTLANWQEMLTPTDAVLSVNGQAGAVNLTTTNIPEGTNLYWTNARGDARYPQLSGSYANPSWITSLAYSKITGVPATFPTSSNLDTVLGNGNTATNSITLGADGNSIGYALFIKRQIPSGGTNYTGSIGVGLDQTALTMNMSDGATTKQMYLPFGGTSILYSPDGGTNKYTVWHSNNHPAGSAFTPTLTGANVPASFTTNSAGHVTGFTTRTLTAADIDATPGAPSASSWSAFIGSVSGRFIASTIGGPNANTWYGLHMPGDANNGAQLAFRGPAVYFRTQLGGVTSAWEALASQSWATSSFAPLSGSGNYIQASPGSPQAAFANVSSYLKVQRNGLSSYQSGILLQNAANTLGVNLQLNEGTNPGLATWIHNGSAWVKRVENFSDGSNTFYGTIRSSVSGANAQITAHTTSVGDAILSADVSGVSASFFRTYRTGGRTAIINNSNEAISILLSGNVGIGTVSPASKLEVSGTATIPVVQSPSGEDLNISSSSGHAILFNPSLVNKAMIDADGRMGIGTTPNSARGSLLEVAGNVWSTDAYLLGTGIVPTAEFYMSGPDVGLRTMNGTANMTFDINQTTEVMRITPASNVGILTTLPSSTLDVKGSFATKTRVISSNAATSVLGTDHTLLFQGFSTGTGTTLNLPNPANCEGRELVMIENTASSWTTNYSISRTTGPALTAVTGTMKIKVVNGSWWLINQL